jgi:hypothetical protein
MAAAMVGMVVVAILVQFTMAVRRASAREVGAIQSWENASKIMIALEDFDAAYGAFPSEATVARVMTDSGTRLNLKGGSSNRLFRQLLVRGKSEKIFYVQGKGSASRAPDEIFADDAHALAPGECGFAYIAGLSSSSDPACPVIVAPLLPGSTRLDPARSYRAVVGFSDGRVEGISADRSGRIMIGGLDLFDPAQPFWAGKTPDVRWQE